MQVRSSRSWPSQPAPRIRPMMQASQGLAAMVVVVPGYAAPGSQQDFVVNVGDRVFFESDSVELTPTAQATLDKQARWLQQYNRYSFTIEGHADERGTREYNFALGAQRAEATKNYLIARGISAGAHAHDQLRQGAPGRGLQRHFLLVAEPPRRHRAERRAILADCRRRQREAAMSGFSLQSDQSKAEIKFWPNCARKPVVQCLVRIDPCCLALPARLASLHRALASCIFGACRRRQLAGADRIRPIFRATLARIRSAPTGRHGRLRRPCRPCG